MDLWREAGRLGMTVELGVEPGDRVRGPQAHAQVGHGLEPPRRQQGPQLLPNLARVLSGPHFTARPEIPGTVRKTPEDTLHASPDAPNAPRRGNLERGTV